MAEIRWKPSVTVAAIIERDGRYLLVEERTADGLRLNNPAGHLDPGESLIAAVAREALEETACPFTPQALVGIYLARTAHAPDGDDISYLRFAFCGSVGEPIAGQALDQPVERTLWLSPQELYLSRDRHRSPLVWQCIADHQAGQRFPLDLLHTHPSVTLLQK
jgi:8-oxo-dGTP pyrophosphatase MutT (NUDIX family)